jgi:carboxyl-terminal processing protease
VAVLTDRGDHSATEDFVMMMRVLPTAVVVGDTTFGTSSNPRIEPLANGWTLRIPQSVQTTPDGLVVEGRGLPPALAVRLDPADAARGADTILRAGVGELRRRLGG